MFIWSVAGVEGSVSGLVVFVELLEWSWTTPRSYTAWGPS